MPYCFLNRQHQAPQQQSPQVVGRYQPHLAGHYWAQSNTGIAALELVKIQSHLFSDQIDKVKGKGSSIFEMVRSRLFFAKRKSGEKVFFQTNDYR